VREGWNQPSIHEILANPGLQRIELFVVIAIIEIFAGLPALSRAKDRRN
jgi:hypothetical protein